MANIVSAVARFYPVNGEMNTKQFMSYYTDFQKLLWRSYFFINKDENCFEVLYPCKSPVIEEIYESNELLDNYHVWLRISDSSCYEDFIGFNSKIYKPDFNEVDYKCQYWSGYTLNWNYASSCLYSANEIEIKFNNPASEFIKKLVQFDRYYEVDQQIKEDLTWNHKMKIVFMKSSQVRFENDYTGEHLEENFYENELGWNDLSSVSGLLINDSRIRLQDEFLNLLNKYNKKLNTIKMDATIDELSFKQNGEPVQKFKWATNLNDEKREGWVESTKCDWSNCIDPEFIKFQTWYNSNR